jgi:uncharacterized membrane protein
MDQNPYAPPRRDSMLPLQVHDAGPGEPRPWEVGEVIEEAWGLFKPHWPVLVGAGVVLYVILIAIKLGTTLVLGGGFSSAENPFSPGALAGAGGSFIAQQVAQMFLQVGLLRIYLATVRGQTPEFGQLFSGGDRFVTTLLSTMLLGLAIFFGFLLLIVPGVILAIGLYNTMFFAADTDLGVVDCLKASWNSLAGQKGKFFAFLLVLGVLNIAGILACFIGLLVSVPVTILALSIVYTRLTGRTGPEPLAAAPAYP